MSLNCWMRISLVLGWMTSISVWWLFWYISINDRTVMAGDNWFENWVEPAWALIASNVILLTLWETFWQALGRRKGDGRAREVKNGVYTREHT